MCSAPDNDNRSLLSDRFVNSRFFKCLSCLNDALLSDFIGLFSIVSERSELVWRSESGISSILLFEKSIRVRHFNLLNISSGCFIVNGRSITPKYLISLNFSTNSSLIVNPSSGLSRSPLNKFFFEFHSSFNDDNRLKRTFTVIVSYS